MNSILRDLMAVFSGKEPSDFTDKEVQGFKIVFISITLISATLTYSKLFY